MYPFFIPVDSITGEITMPWANPPRGLREYCAGESNEQVWNQLHLIYRTYSATPGEVSYEIVSVREIIGKN